MSLTVTPKFTQFANVIASFIINHDDAESYDIVYSNYADNVTGDNSKQLVHGTAALTTAKVGDELPTLSAFPLAKAIIYCLTGEPINGIEIHSVGGHSRTTLSRWLAEVSTSDTVEHSFRPSCGAIDVQAHNSEIAQEKLNAALTDPRTKAVLSEYGVSIDWFDSEFIEPE